VRENISDNRVDFLQALNSPNHEEITTHIAKLLPKGYDK